jgi:copper(I)-binding protein
MKRLLISVGVALAAICSAASAEVVVDSAWVRAAPPGATMLAGYATLRNSGIASKAFESVEMHRTEEVDGVSRMRPVAAIEIPPDGAAVLEPGGLHLMLIRPRQPLAEGDTVILRLRFADGRVVDAAFPVQRSAGEDPHAGHHRHH